jgi:hypothetical protein
MAYDSIGPMHTVMGYTCTHQQNPNALEEKQSPEAQENLWLHLQAPEASGNPGISRGLMRMLGFF